MTQKQSPAFNNDVKSKEGLWVFIHGKSHFFWPAESPGYHQW